MAAKLTTLHSRRGAVRHVTVLDTTETIATLAKKTHYSAAHLSRIFRRLDGPSPDCLIKLAAALGKSPAVLARLLKKPRRRAMQWPSS